MAEIDVITPVFGQADLTIDCVRHLDACGSDLRWIWVDNASPAKDVRKIERAIRKLSIPWIRVEMASNTGFVVATNSGIEASSAPYLLLLNNDTRVYPGTLERMKAAFEEPDAGISGPVSSSGWQGWPNLVHKVEVFTVLYQDGAFDRTDAEIAQALGSRLDGQRWRLHPAKGMLAFFCALIRREVIERIGLLDERYGVGFGDDDDYCEAARRAGFSLWFCADAYCWHSHRTTFRTLYSEHDIMERQQHAMEILHDKWGRPRGR